MDGAPRLNVPAVRRCWRRTWEQLGSNQQTNQQMSTSHYSRPYRPAHVAPNTRKFTVAKIATICALLVADLLALIGSTNLGEALALVCLVIVNLWALNWSK